MNRTSVGSLMPAPTGVQNRCRAQRVTFWARRLASSRAAACEA